MKYIFKFSIRLNSNRRLLIGLFFGLLLSVSLLLAGLGAISKAIGEHKESMSSPHAVPSANLSAVFEKRCCIQIQARHIAISTKRKSASGQSNPAAAPAQDIVANGLLEMELGSHLVRRAAMYSMPQPRPWMPTLCWLASRQVAASAARFTVRLTLR